MSSPQQFQSIQVLRGAAALVVVLFHASILSVDYFGGGLYDPWTLVGKAGVDLFFVISGFIMVYTTSATFGQPGSASRFAISRVSRVYPPYWILSALVFAYWLYNPSGVNSKTGGVDPVASFLLLPSASLPLVPVAWTLVYEMFFYLVFWIIIAIGSRRLLLPALVIWAAACFVNMITGIVSSDDMIRGLTLSPFNLEFIAGALIAYFGGRGFGRVFFALGILWFVLLAIWFHFTQQADSIPVALRVAWFLPPSVALVYGMVALETVDKQAWSSSRLLAWIGDWSYSLYLVHILVLHAVYRVATRKIKVDWSDLQLGLPLAIFAVCLSLVVSYVFYLYVERPSSMRARSWLSAVVLKRALRAS
jgi:peptidoglycan/LPS O-acetylase OafA/YrhL